MVTKRPPGAELYVPKSKSLATLERAASRCEGCDLYKSATQTVFGEGKRGAEIMFVGETPGDQEDRQGKPFVGPAGRLLDELLDELSIRRNDIYLTNVVKHFKFEPRGKRRIHSKPLASEVAACRAWLEAEIISIRPKVILCLGATAAHAFMGSKLALTRDRGKAFETEWASALIATYHPAAVLRAPDPETRAKMRGELRSDIARAIAALKRSPKKASIER